MADTQITGTLSVDNAINGSLSANEGINGSLTPDEEVSGTLEVTRTRVVATMLSELEDVELDDLQDDDILVYDSLDGKWHNEANAGGGGVWGTITGTLSDQTDLQAALDEKYGTNDTAETDIADADYIPFYDTSASAKRKSLWSNIKAKLNEIFFRRSEQRVLGAKNLLPNNAVSTEYNGITYTVNADGTVGVNGSTSSSSSLLKLSEISLKSGDKYIVSGGYNNKVRINIYLKSNPSTEILVADTDYLWTVPATGTYAVQIYVNTNTSVTNALLKPMIRLETDADSTYQPFAMTNKELTDKFGTLGSAATKDVPASGDAGQTEVVLGSDTRLTDARTPTEHTHITSEITDFPTLATVATSGSYNDLSNTPTIPDELADLSDDGTHRLVTDTEKSTWNNKCDNSVVAPVESGSTASRAYAVGEHFIKDGAFCTAKTAIASGATFTLNTNYTEGSIADDVIQSNWSYTTSGLTPTNCTIVSGGYCKIGNLVIVNVRLTATAESGVQIAGFPTYSNKASAGVIDYISTIGSTAALAQTVMGGNGTALIYKVGSTTLSNQTVRFSFMYLCN